MEKSEKSSWFERCSCYGVVLDIRFYIGFFSGKKVKKNLCVCNFNFHEIAIARLDSPWIINFFDVFRSKQYCMVFVAFECKVLHSTLLSCHYKLYRYRNGHIQNSRTPFRREIKPIWVRKYHVPEPRKWHIHFLMYVKMMSVVVREKTTNINTFRVFGTIINTEGQILIHGTIINTFWA